MHVHGSKHPREQVGVAMGNELLVCVNILIQRDGWRGGGESVRNSRHDKQMTCIELGR